MRTNEITLKSALNQVMVITILLVVSLAFGALFTYSQIKQSLQEKSVQENLLKSADRQIESIVPSFLVPEQRSGISVQLERYKEIEDLDQIEIIDEGRTLPDGFRNCKIGSSESLCVSSDRSQIGVTIPIQVADRKFGYLFKSKKVQNVLAHDHTLQMIEFVAAALLLFSILFFVFLSKVTSKEVPADLDNLVMWLEAILEGRTSSRVPRLRFQELNLLGEKIGELLERHEKSRDRAMIGLLASGIMHDIKTPLHSVVTAQLLVAELPQNSDKRSKLLENLFRVCTNKLPVIGGIIESTLDGSREIHIEKKFADLSETVADSLSLYSTHIEQKSIRIESPNSEPVFIEHDPIQLGRVISNLVKNSLEALNEHSNMKEKSSIDLSIHLDCTEVGVTKVILEDAGPGLPDNPENVFRLLRGTKARSSGLGLVVSRKIVQAHEGTLIATQGQFLPGARFEIRLPNSTKNQEVIAGDTA
jgi:signal transduction histidine kinase